MYRNAGKDSFFEGNTAKTDFSGNVVDVNVGLVDVSVGQYVLVHAGCAIEVMDKNKAEELIEIFSDLEDM